VGSLCISINLSFIKNLFQMEAVKENAVKDSKKTLTEAQQAEINALRQAGFKSLDQFGSSINDAPGEYSAVIISGTQSVRSGVSKKGSRYIVTPVSVKLETGSIIEVDTKGVPYNIGEVVKVEVTKPNEAGYKSARLI
jgi:hypothetical protein